MRRVAVLSSLSRHLRAPDSTRPILFLVGLLLVLTPILAVLRLNIGETPPDGTLGYTAEQAYQMLDAAGDAGRQYHLVFELLDLFYIPVYVALLATTIAYTFRKLFGRSDRVVNAVDLVLMVPLFAGLVDYAENAALLTLLARYPEQLPALAALAGALTSVKWTLVTLAFCLAASGGTAIGIGAAIRTARRIRGSRSLAHPAIGEVVSRSAKPGTTKPGILEIVRGLLSLHGMFCPHFLGWPCTLPRRAA
jgi:hypothetical protein